VALKKQGTQPRLPLSENEGLAEISTPKTKASTSQKASVVKIKKTGVKRARKADASPTTPRFIAALDATAALQSLGSTEDGGSSSDESEDDDELGFKGATLDRSSDFKVKLSLTNSSTLQNQAVTKWKQEEKKEEEEVAHGSSMKKAPVLPTRLDSGATKASVSSLRQKQMDKITDGVYKTAISKDQERSKARRNGELRDWFEMKTPEITPEVERDLKVLQLRNYMDPKRFYKANDAKTLPKAFQIGTVVEGLGEFKSHRLTNRERKPTFVDQVLADRSIRSYTKRVYLDVQREKGNFTRHAKRNKKGGKHKAKRAKMSK